MFYNIIHYLLHFIHPLLTFQKYYHLGWQYDRTEKLEVENIHMEKCKKNDSNQTSKFSERFLEGVKLEDKNIASPQCTEWAQSFPSKAKSFNLSEVSKLLNLRSVMFQSWERGEESKSKISQTTEQWTHRVPTQVTGFKSCFCVS